MVMYATVPNLVGLWSVTWGSCSNLIRPNSLAPILTPAPSIFTTSWALHSVNVEHHGSWAVEHGMINESKHTSPGWTSNTPRQGTLYVHRSLRHHNSCNRRPWPINPDAWKIHPKAWSHLWIHFNQLKIITNVCCSYKTIAWTIELLAWFLRVAVWKCVSVSRHCAHRQWFLEDSVNPGGTPCVLI